MRLTESALRRKRERDPARPEYLIPDDRGSCADRVDASAGAPPNFLSAATGIAVALALVRGFTRHDTATIGNAWVDLTRATLYLLLPLSLVFALVLAGQGVIQTLAPALTLETLDGAAGAATQTLALGPVASQEAIKLLGTNGGGFFNANSAHPFENPTPLGGLVPLVLIQLGEVIFGGGWAPGSTASCCLRSWRSSSPGS